MDHSEDYLKYLIKKTDFLFEYEDIFLNKNLNFIKEEITKSLNQFSSIGLVGFLDKLLDHYSQNYDKNFEIISQLIDLGADPSINDGDIIKKAINYNDSNLIYKISKDKTINFEPYIKLLEDQPLNDPKIYSVKIVEPLRKQQNLSIELSQYIMDDDYDSFVNYYEKNKDTINLHAKNESLFISATSFNRSKFVDFLVKNGAGYQHEEVNHKILLKQNLFSYQKEYLTSKSNIDLKNLPEDLKSVISTYDKQPGLLLNKVNSLFKKYNTTIDNEKELLNSVFDFAVENKYEKSIDFFLSMGVFPKKHQKDIFISAVKEKNTSRLLMIWNPIEDPLDLSAYIQIAKKPNHIKIKSDDFLISRLSFAPLFEINKFKEAPYYLTEKEKEAQCYQYLYSINNRGIDKNNLSDHFEMIFIYCKNKIDKEKEKEEINLKRAFSLENLLLGIKHPIKKETLEVTEHLFHEYSYPSLIEEIKQDIETILNPKKVEEKIEIIEPKNIIESSQENNEPIELDNVKKSISTKKDSSNSKPKEIIKITSLNNETLTRKDIQKRWDTFLAKDFFTPEKEARPMYVNVLRFLSDNGLTSDMLKANNLTIYRMPLESNSFQFNKNSRQFVCSYMPPLAEILFNETPNTIDNNLNKILSTIVKQKIRTQMSSSNRTAIENKEDIAEFKIASAKFRAMGQSFAISDMNKNAKTNWGICK